MRVPVRCRLADELRTGDCATARSRPQPYEIPPRQFFVMHDFPLPVLIAATRARVNRP
jgi:hypothetical protein